MRPALFGNSPVFYLRERRKQIFAEGVHREKVKLLLGAATKTDNGLTKSRACLTGLTKQA